MLVSSSRTILRHVRVCGVLLVAALFFVPPLVRATQHLYRGTTSSPLRLNRGFDAPKTKCQVAPPGDVALGSIVLEEPRSVQIAWRFRAVDEPLPNSLL